MKFYLTSEALLGRLTVRGFPDCWSDANLLLMCVCVCVCVCFEGENAQGTRGDDVHAMKDRRMTQVLLPLCTIHDVGGDLRNMTVFIFWKAGFIELHREQ